MFTMSVYGFTLGSKAFFTACLIPVLGIGFALLHAGLTGYKHEPSARDKLWLVFYSLFSTLAGLFLIWAIIPLAYYGNAVYEGEKEIISCNSQSVEGCTEADSMKVKHIVNIDGRKLTINNKGIHMYNPGDTVPVRCSGGACKLH